MLAGVCASAASVVDLCRVCVCVCPQEEQAAKTKAESIRVALEKIKEAQVKKASHTHPALTRVRWLGFLGQVSVTLVNNSWGQAALTIMTTTAS